VFSNLPPSVTVDILLHQALHTPGWIRRSSATLLRPPLHKGYATRLSPPALWIRVGKVMSHPGVPSWCISFDWNRMHRGKWSATSVKRHSCFAEACSLCCRDGCRSGACRRLCTEPYWWGGGGRRQGLHRECWHRSCLQTEKTSSHFHSPRLSHTKGFPCAAPLLSHLDE